MPISASLNLETSLCVPKNEHAGTSRQCFCFVITWEEVCNFLKKICYLSPNMFLFLLSFFSLPSPIISQILIFVSSPPCRPPQCQTYILPAPNSRKSLGSFCSNKNPGVPFLGPAYIMDQPLTQSLWPWALMIWQPGLKSNPFVVARSKVG